ncbi:sulfotransferase [Henriciella sp. AS95]|uniref:tetratricopeptide repeat-containing sulfotransferase family protein n=1 Tax=Henriciella sp. AS95 TaxID=3135782 RepID=UPI00316F837A
MTDAPRGTIRQAFERARGLVQQGQRTLAVQQLEAILEAEPNEVNALLLLGSLRSVEGRLKDAEALVRKASDLAPDFHDASLELARIQRLSKNTSDAINTLRKLIDRAPSNNRAWQLLGDSLYENGQTREGRDAFRQAAQVDPHRNQIRGAIEALKDGRNHEAEQSLRAVLTAEPNHVHALVGLASLAIEAGATEDAEHLLEHARRISPYSDIVWRNVARLHSERANNGAAVEAARRAVELDPDAADAWSMLGNVQAWGLKPEEAEASFTRSLELRNEQPRVWMSLGHVRKTLGNRQGSEAAYKEAISQQPDLGEAFWSLADLKTYVFSDADLQSMLSMLQTPGVGDTDLAGFHFALGKAFEDRKDFGPSFEHYAAGNAIKARLDPFDADGFSDTINAVEQVFDTAFMGTPPLPAPPDEIVPVFIVGLPRSGSTLVEQILASHSRVEGTMELPHILNYVRSMKSGGGYPQSVADMPPEELRALGERYIAETEAYRTGQDFFIDKMPNNFLHVGLIAKMLPQAVFIDARRDPRDCCLSAFKQNFARGQTFSYGLDILGQYYRDYLRVMRHWDHVLPGRVHRVQYESMVSDTEREIRNLLAHCGLDFEPACLAFHETRRAVRTASAEQVRQPIYARGVGHWKNFEPWLGELFTALGDAIPSDTPNASGTSDNNI